MRDRLLRRRPVEEITGMSRPSIYRQEYGPGFSRDLTRVADSSVEVPLRHDGTHICCHTRGGMVRATRGTDWAHICIDQV